MMTDSKGKGGKTKPKERKSVSFNPTVGVREYERRYNGSGGVPHMGGYPLGLGSTYVEKSEPIVTPKKLNARLESGHVFTVLTEKQRKKLLRKFDPSCPK